MSRPISLLLLGATLLLATQGRRYASCEKFEAQHAPSYTEPLDVCNESGAQRVRRSAHAGSPSGRHHEARNVGENIRAHIDHHRKAGDIHKHPMNHYIEHARDKHPHGHPHKPTQEPVMEAEEAKDSFDTEAAHRERHRKAGNLHKLGRHHFVLHAKSHRKPHEPTDERQIETVEVDEDEMEEIEQLAVPIKGKEEDDDDLVWDAEVKELDDTHKKGKTAPQHIPADGYPCTCDDRDGGTIDCRKQELKTTFIAPSPRRTKMNVAHVYLSGNRITGLFTDFVLDSVHRGEVRHLDLSYNDICYIQDGAFEGMNRLSELILTYNRLERLGENSFGLLHSLTELRLDNNRIVNITGAVFEDLDQLRFLSLSNNPLKHMSSETFRGLDDLEELDLENTQLSYLDPELFFELSKLRTLKLNRNKFLVLPTLHNLPSLQILDISHNDILELNSHSLEGLTRLREIMVNHMPRLHSVEQCAFCGARRLEVLQMFNNSQLYFIDSEAFGTGAGKADGSMKTVDLVNCNLHYLSPQLLDWTNLTSLRLGGNPWNCDCRLAWMTDIRIGFQDPLPRCNSPDSLKEHYVDSMHPKQMCGSGQRRAGGLSIGKVFVGLTVLLLITASLALGWFCWLNKGGRVVGNPVLPSIGKKRKRGPHYQYRNLAMAEEVDEAEGEDELYSKTNARVPPPVEL